MKLFSTNYPPRPAIRTGKLQATSYKLEAVFGFSLIEMLVVISIFLIMTLVVLSNMPAFRDKTALQLVAQEISVTIRQAQIYGIGTRSSSGGTTNFPSYGLYFDITPSGDRRSFILYADKNSPAGFGGDSANVIERFVVRGGVDITNLYACDSSCSSISSNLLDFSFQRFYPDAEFTGITASSVKVELQSARTGDKKFVEVRKSGQILVTDNL
ncbi:MAG: type II secretion system protein [Patescibacteria group bacterium]